MRQGNPVTMMTFDLCKAHSIPCVNLKLRPAMQRVSSALLVFVVTVFLTTFSVALIAAAWLMTAYCLNGPAPSSWTAGLSFQ